MNQSHDKKWEEVETDPNPNTDLGYDLQSLTVFRFGEGDERYMVLPADAEHLHRDEFIVATAGSVSDLEGCR